MKLQAVFITFNQAHTERVEYIIDNMNIRGYSFWENLQGRGTTSGEPRYGTHTWPEMNSAVITMVPEDVVDLLLENIKKLDDVNPEVGIRAFVWDVVRSY